ncbi:MAG: efflux RND transporter periplasmic adaptor subunit [candidate division WOR-3 bacterium]
MKSRTRTLLIAIGAAVVLALVVVLNLKRPAPSESVTAETVKYGSIVSVVSATGKLRAQSQVNLQAQVMGTVNRLLVEEGDWVEKGDLLLELDRKTYEAQLVLARSSFEQAQASFGRIESLYARGLISAEQHEAAKASYEAARAQYEQAEDQLAKTSLRAPISGTVVQLNVKQGETVMLGTMNNPGTVIMVLADMSRMEARIDVDETDVVSLALGQPVRVEVDALPDTAFAGQVTKIGYMPTTSLLSTETQGTDFEVIVTLESVSPVLRPGMSVSAEITTASLDSVLVIPLQAVGRREVEGREQETVYLIEDGKAKLQVIRTGKASDTEVEVTEGLKPGDQVVTGPYKVLAKLKEGRRVTPSRVAAGPTFTENKKSEGTR